MVFFHCCCFSRIWISSVWFVKGGWSLGLCRFCWLITWGWIVVFFFCIAQQSTPDHGPLTMHEGCCVLPQAAIESEGLKLAVHGYWSTAFQPWLLCLLTKFKRMFCGAGMFSRTDKKGCSQKEELKGIGIGHHSCCKILGKELDEWPKEKTGWLRVHTLDHDSLFIKDTECLWLFRTSHKDMKDMNLMTYTRLYTLYFKKQSFLWSTNEKALWLCGFTADMAGV